MNTPLYARNSHGVVARKPACMLEPTAYHLQEVVYNSLMRWHAFLQVDAVSFYALMTTRSKAEVSRMFSAMLQLINNGNMQIHHGSSPDDPIKLQLCSLHQPHQHFLEYQAPSVLGVSQVQQHCKSSTITCLFQGVLTCNAESAAPLPAVGTIAALCSQYKN